nr:MAG TPA: hypothetical protein [Caudoviricetes sp.]
MQFLITILRTETIMIVLNRKHIRQNLQKWARYTR